MTDSSIDPIPYMPPSIMPNRGDLDDLASGWLREKVGRTGSASTERNYGTFLADFRLALANLNLALDSEPSLVAPVAKGWADREVLDGHSAPKPPSAAYHNQRLAALSSFYEYAIRMGALMQNPIATVARRPIQNKAASESPDFASLRKKLATIDRTDLTGQRDHTLLTIALVTGRRLGEITSLRMSDLVVTDADSANGAQVQITWHRAKGGNATVECLPTSLSRDLLDYLAAFYGPTFASLPNESPVWVSLSNNAYGHALDGTSVSAICRRRLGIKFKMLRAAFAVAMRRIWDSLTEIQAKSWHPDPSTPIRYLNFVEPAENTYTETILKGLDID